MRIEGDGVSELGTPSGGGAGSPRTPASSAAEKLDEPGAARVDDACLAQSRQQLGRAGERPLALRERGLEGALRTAVSRRVGAASHLADDRQHRSLDGHRDRRVGRIAGRGECPGDGSSVEATVARELDGGASHDLRQDDPGVAAGSHQRRACRRLGLPRRVGRRRAPRVAAARACTVRAMFVPVSPSGTGKTFRSSILRRAASSVALAVSTAASTEACPCVALTLGRSSPSSVPPCGRDRA